MRGNEEYVGKSSEEKEGEMGGNEEYMWERSEEKEEGRKLIVCGEVI